MKIYVNDNWEICEIHKSDRGDLKEIDVNSSELGNWCDAALLGFKYEPSYECDFKGDFVLDDAGNLIQSGYAFYPFIDSNAIYLIQKHYELNEIKMAENYEYNIDLDHRLSCLELGV